MVKSIARRDVFLDVCTQFDYLHPHGQRPIANLPTLTRALKRGLAFVRWSKASLVSCVELRRPSDGPHGDSRACVRGTRGQRKPSYTLMPSRIMIDSDGSHTVGLDVLLQHQQVILVKNDRDPFANPKIDRLLTEVPADQFVIWGVDLEVTVRLLALGLLLRGRRVAVIADACGYWDPEQADMTLRQLQAKGCHVVTAREFVRERLAARRHPRRVFEGFNPADIETAGSTAKR